MGNGGKCPSYKLRSASSYCFCLFLEKQRLGTEESVDFLENVYFECPASTNPQVFSWIHLCHPRTAYSHMGCFLWLSLYLSICYIWMNICLLQIFCYSFFLKLFILK